MTSDCSVFRNSVATAKSSAKSLPGSIFRVRTFVQADLDDTALLESVTKWRRDNQKPFLKLFSPTVDATKNWASGVLQNKDRILFLIEDHNRPIGHIGICDFGDGFEICDVVRGETSASGTIDDALLSVIRWALDSGLASLHLHVAADALAAVMLYHRVGFVPDQIVPLARHRQGSETMWQPSDDQHDRIDRYMLRMKYAI